MAELWDGCSSDMLDRCFAKVLVRYAEYGLRQITERACFSFAGNLTTAFGHVLGSLLWIRQKSNIPALLRAAGIY